MSSGLYRPFLEKGQTFVEPDKAETEAERQKGYNDAITHYTNKGVPAFETQQGMRGPEDIAARLQRK